MTSPWLSRPLFTGLIRNVASLRGSKFDAPPSSELACKCSPASSNLSHPRRAKRALGSRENSGRLTLLDSEMAGPIGLKLGGMVEGMCENVLAKKFFGSVEVDRGQVSGPQVPLLGRGDDKETPNWA